MLNLGQLNTIKSYMDNGQFEAMDEYLSQVYGKQKVGQLEPQVSDDLGRKFIEKAYLYRCNYIRDTDNWEGRYSYLIADSFEEAYELAKILYDKENIIDIKYIECKKEDDIYGCYMLAPNSL